MQTKLAAILISACVTILTGCSQMTDLSGAQVTKSETPPSLNSDKLPSVICTSFEPLGWSDDDTPETVKGIKKHNFKWLAICDPATFKQRFKREFNAQKHPHILAQ